MTAGPSLGPASAYPTFRTPASICFSEPKDVFVPGLSVFIGESPWFDVMNDRYDTLLPKGAARSPARPGNRCTWSSSTNTPTSRPPWVTRNSKPNSRLHRCIPWHQGTQIPQRTFRSKRDCAYDGELATVTICRRDCSAGHRKLYHI